MPDLHIRPLAPHFRQVVDILEVNLSRLLEDLTSVVEVRLRFTRCTSLFVELGKVNVETVEVSRSPPRINSRQGLSVRFYYLL